MKAPQAELTVPAVPQARYPAPCFHKLDMYLTGKVKAIVYMVSTTTIARAFISGQQSEADNIDLHLYLSWPH